MAENHPRTRFFASFHDLDRERRPLAEEMNAPFPSVVAVSVDQEVARLGEMASAESGFDNRLKQVVEELNEALLDWAIKEDVFAIPEVREVRRFQSESGWDLWVRLSSRDEKAERKLVSRICEIEAKLETDLEFMFISNAKDFPVGPARRSLERGWKGGSRRTPREGQE